MNEKIIMVGNLIQFHRKQAGISQKELADLAGVGKTAVFDLERGKSNFKIETLFKIMEILNLKLDFKSPLMAIWRNSYEKDSAKTS